MQVLVKFPLFIALALLTTGCVVSKKKYDSLADAKKRSDQRARQLQKENGNLSQQLNKAENQARKLDNELDQLKKEYNQIKNQMMASNAEKTNAITQLKQQVATLSTDKSSLKDSLETAISRYQRKSSKLREKKMAMEQEISEIEGYKRTVATYQERLEKLEASMQNLVNKNNIEGVKPFLQEGKMVITFDNEALFTASGALSSNGKRTLLIIGGLMDKYDYLLLDVAGNWAGSVDKSTAWNTTCDRAGLVYAFLLEKGHSSIERFAISGEKINDQSIGDKEYASALVMYPELDTFIQ